MPHVTAKLPESTLHWLRHQMALGTDEVNAFNIRNVLGMNETREQLSVYLEYVLSLTAFAAGSVDVVSFERLGGIFASAMTGNLAFLAIYVARLSFVSAIGSSIALFGFVVGCASGHLFTRNASWSSSLNVLLGAEFLLLFGVIELWLPGGLKSGSFRADSLISLLSISMGMQSILGKKINLSNIPTVVFTSTLTNLIIGVTNALVAKKFILPKDTKRQLSSLFLYFFGAVTTGLLAHLNLSILVVLPMTSTGIALVTKVLHIE